MGEDYKFVSKFIEGKTYKELTEEEIEKLKSGVGVKKEDKEYLVSLEKIIPEINEVNDEEINDNVQEPTNEDLDKKEEKPEETQKEKKVVEVQNELQKGTKVMRACGKILILEDKRTIELTKEELKDKPFWKKGDVYYG